MTERIPRVDNRVFEHSHQQTGKRRFDDNVLRFERVRNRTDIFALADEFALFVVHIDETSDIRSNPGFLAGTCNDGPPPRPPDGGL